MRMGPHLVCNKRKSFKDIRLSWWREIDANWNYLAGGASGELTTPKETWAY